MVLITRCVFFLILWRRSSVWARLTKEKKALKESSYMMKMDFAVEARMSKLYGLWAAEQLGLSGADADTYAQSVVTANLEEPGFDDVLRKVRKDFDEKGLEISDHIMNVELEKAFNEAKNRLNHKNYTTLETKKLFALLAGAYFVLCFLYSMSAYALDTPDIKLKADKSLSSLKAYMTLGCDVSAVVPQMKKVKALRRKRQSPTSQCFTR